MAKQTASLDTPEEPLPQVNEGYTVLARRYRPQTFQDLVGQEPVARALGNAIKSNRVAHAYLFTGARGVGKTSTARILAKALNCVHGPTPNPCAVCDVCRSIATGEDVDVLEIDGASNNGVDDVRGLRGNAQYSPVRARYKIYIIDEVHMLSKGAFNALLKTLEEPPPHVKFIFATTEVDKVPITILSRCQRFDFAGISTPRIVERLRGIAQSEGIRADPEALELVARRAAGSMRDAQSLLDQLLAFGGDTLTVDQVHHLLGTAGDERILALAEAVVNNDAKKALDLLAEAAASGLQIGELLDQLMAYWRDLMVVQCGGTEGRDLSVPARHHDTLRRHSKTISLDSVLAGLDVLSATKARLRGSSHGRTLVEMALVRLCRLHDLVALSQLAQWLGQARPEPRTVSPAALNQGGGLARSGLPEIVKKKHLMAADEPVTIANGEQPLLDEAAWPHFWKEIGAAVGSMLAAQLAKGCPPAIIGPNTLVFRFPAGYNQERAYCQATERLARIESAVRQVTGKSWVIRLEAESTQPAATPVRPASEQETGRAEPINGAVCPTRGAKKNPRDEAARVALVKRALDVLGATIKDVDEGFGDPASNGRQGGES